MIDPKVRVQQSSALSVKAKPLAEPEVVAKREKANAVSEHEVRSYAYELYQRRGGTEDHAVEDWLSAEAYVAALKNRAN